MNKALTISGSAIAIANDAVIIMGPSGSGKSDLALRLIDRGARLIADDLITIIGDYNRPIAAQSAHHINAMEIRGVGIIPMDCVDNIMLKLMVQLNGDYERGPAPLPLVNYGHYTIPCLKLAPFEISAPIKIEQTLINLERLTNIKNGH